MLTAACQTGTHSHADRGPDLYETPVEAVHALLRAEKIENAVWEPACGPGAIVSVLREQGYRVYATDLFNHGCEDSDAGINFLEAHDPGFYVGTILTNPPYKLAAQFVSHALTLAPKVIMLLRLAFLESERRRAILESGQLAKVHVFRNRLPMMHRHNWTGPKSTSAVPFAWFVWDRNHKGAPELHRLSWERL